MTGQVFKPTPQQKAVIEHDRSAFVTACPGAGKTRVMVERARHLSVTNKSGRGVAFLSFTKAAVAELEGRLRRDGLLSSPPFPNFIGTFDSFIWLFLISPFGVPGSAAAPRLIPDKDELTVQPFPGARPLPLGFFDKITGAINANESRTLGFDPARNAGQTQAYVTAARNIRAHFLERAEIDFDEARTIAKARIADAVLSPKLGAVLAARFGEVIVDEAQDCNPDDLDIIGWFRTVGIVVKVICDPHQSIYAFRGGVTEQLIAFGLTFHALDRLLMSGNFRSSDHICKSIVALRRIDSRAVIDEALGKHRGEPTHVHVLSYKGKSVPSKIGTKFHELVAALDVSTLDSPVLSKTKASGAKAVGQPPEANTQDMLLCLAQAVTDFHFCSALINRKTALEAVYRAVLRIEGRLEGKSFHQYLNDEVITGDMWRPRILHLARELRYETPRFADADAWHDRAKQLIAPGLVPGGPSISQRLRRNNALADLLAVPSSSSSPCARTIHSVKGMEFPAVCVVVSTTTATGIMDYLENGLRPENAEDAREIYVAASRAERLLVFAVPISQAQRMTDHLTATGASVTLMPLDPPKVKKAKKVTAKRARKAKAA
jgi:DNA helicase-2/ATP-dependent DNA helicase PcrA